MKSSTATLQIGKILVSQTLDKPNDRIIISHNQKQGDDQMTNLIIARRTAVTLNGNKLSGNTYPAKEYIKAYLGGKWDGATKTWIVDVEKVNDLITKQAIRVDDSAPVAAAPKAYVSGWCNKCKSYCYGDCES